MFISYAQNYEDLMLYRALKHVEGGFYIDIGANDPFHDSVTKAFYDEGWSGINIEPVKQYISKLNKERPRDKNLKVAISDVNGETEISIPGIRGWETLDKKTIKRYEERGMERSREIVKTLTLENVFKNYVNKEVHFLKVDVEGYEERVLIGNDWRKFRPWVIVIEALQPITQEENYKVWEKILLEANYLFAYADGLNRFYISKEHKELLPSFKYPPNVFDDFIKWDVTKYQAKAQAADAKAQAADAKVQEADARAQAADARAQAADAHATQANEKAHELEIAIQGLNGVLESIYNSKAWKIVLVLRNLKYYVIYPFSKTFKYMKAFISKILSFLIPIFFKKPYLKKIILKILEKFPKLHTKIIEFAIFRGLVGSDLSNTTNNKVMEEAYINRLQNFEEMEEPYIFYYVDHTSEYESNTGVQRLTRELAEQLLKNGEKIIFIKWDEQFGFVPINKKQLDNLEKWDGPKLNLKQRTFYYNTKKIPDKFFNNPNSLLIVPEVPHINYHNRPLTYDIVKRAKQLNLKLGAIFYDATPLRSQDLIDVAHTHSEYMKHLLLFDYVWPISDFVKKDLLTFWHKFQLADNKTIPYTKTITLPANHGLSKRPKASSKKNESKIILCIGSIDKRKNQIRLMKAFTSICEKNLNFGWKLILVGHCSGDLYEEVINSTKKGYIEYLHNASNDRLNELYKKCDFTVFPSLLEGFGLPILESLWYGKPCICANFGAMQEIANAHGGCLTTDVNKVKSLEKAVTLLIENKALRKKLSLEAKSSDIKSWKHYSEDILDQHAHQCDPKQTLGFIFFDITLTGSYEFNSGIQRVVRQVAKSFLNQGFKLIPICFENGDFIIATKKQLINIAQFNGPAPDLWSEWQDPSSNAAKWFFTAELNHNIDGSYTKSRNLFCKKHNIKSAVIYYDSIPWDLRDLYPPESAAAHKEYLYDLANYDLNFSISNYSSQNLMCFYLNEGKKYISTNTSLLSIPLGVNSLGYRRTKSFVSNLKNKKTINILSVGTVEPRKNHINLIKAFFIAEKKLNTKNIEIRLNIAGSNNSYDEDLQRNVENMILNHKNIKWYKRVSDIELTKLYKKSDFTVFQSTEEGYGLPIVESLWFGKPCICSNFGAMGEVSSSGGCLHADVSDVNDLASKICDLILKDNLFSEKINELGKVKFKSWNYYVNELALHMHHKQNSADKKLPDILKNTISKNEIEKTSLQLKNITNKPRLSICITTYNRAKWLNLSLKNIFRLLPSPNNEIEIVVCDNKSTDNTSDIIKKFEKRPDLKYRRNSKNVGMLGNLKETVNIAEGDYIWIVGDDDILLNTSIKSILNSIKKYPKIPLIYLNYSTTTEETPSDISKLGKYLDNATPAWDPLESTCRHASLSIL